MARRRRACWGCPIGCGAAGAAGAILIADTGKINRGSRMLEQFEKLPPLLQNYKARHGQGTRQLCRWADAGRGVSVDIQPGGVVQDAVSDPPAISSRKRGGGREMVISRPAPAACLSAASLLTDRTSRAVKEAKLPAAARNHKGPALSAREASASPATKRAGLKPFMTLSTCLSPTAVTRQMLSPPSDRTRPFEQEGSGEPGWRTPHE